MDRRRLALLLVVVGGLCLPAPWYLGWAAQATGPPQQTSQIYAAEPIDLGNASDRERFVDRHADGITLSHARLTARYGGDDYRAPNATGEVVAAAMANGSASTSNEAVRADLRSIGAAYEFVRRYEDDEAAYYRVTVADDGGSVRADPVSVGVVANATAERAPRYGGLSAGERETVDAVLESDGDAGHRPQVDAPYAERLPTAIRKDGALYSVYVRGHVDDFGPGFGGFVVGLGVAGLGLVLVVAGAGVFLYQRVAG